MVLVSALNVFSLGLPLMIMLMCGANGRGVVCDSGVFCLVRVRNYGAV